MSGLVPFLIIARKWKATNPSLLPTISSNKSNQNLEIAILFNIDERSGNYVFEDDNFLLPTILKGKGRKLCRGGL